MCVSNERERVHGVKVDPRAVGVAYKHLTDGTAFLKQFLPWFLPDAPMARPPACGAAARLGLVAGACSSAERSLVVVRTCDALSPTPLQCSSLNVLDEVHATAALAL